MCPNLELLRTYKVYPRKIDFNYMKDRFFIYVYLNPFKELTTPLKVRVGSKEFCFAYEPVYLGKGTGAGYRHNQHLTSFKNNKESNQFKIKTFMEIQRGMTQAAVNRDFKYPLNWKDYQDQYIIILETFKTAEQLLRFEVEMIKKIGTQFDGSGPLANKIKNAFRYDLALRTGNGEAF
jgi:hypothetical protein